MGLEKSSPFFIGKIYENKNLSTTNHDGTV